MHKIPVKVNTINLVKEFSGIAEKIDADMELTDGEHIVNAKSILGIFSINLTQILTLTIHSDDVGIISVFSKFAV